MCVCVCVGREYACEDYLWGWGLSMGFYGIWKLGFKISDRTLSRSNWMKSAFGGRKTGDSRVDL